MTLQSSGSISTSQIKAEFSERFPNNPVIISQYRNYGCPLPKIPGSGPIKFSNFYGKSYRQIINITYTGNVNNINILAAAQPFFISGTPANIIVTINTGVIIGSNSTASYALAVPSGPYPVDGSNNTRIFIYNYGYIVGKGGDGGTGNNDDGGGGDGGNGGPALLIQYPTTIYNYQTIAGGGGGGAGGPGDKDPAGKNSCNRTFNGGGGGGGAGSVAGSGGTSSAGNSGSAGTLLTGGNGGPSGGADNCGYAGAGGKGGDLGQSGGLAGRWGQGNCNYDRANPCDSNSSAPAIPGSAGSYAVGNSNITWAIGGTRLGSVS